MKIIKKCIYVKGMCEIWAERPETIYVGANVLGRVNPENIYKYTKEMLTRKRCWKNPFGYGNAAGIIVEKLKCRKPN